MKTVQSKKIKFYCALFFALFGIFNIAAAGWNHTIIKLDWVFLVVSMLPLLTNNRGLLLILSGIGMVISSCIGFTALLFSPELYASTTLFVFCFGFLVVLASIGASFGLAYAALQNDKHTFRLI